MNINTQLNIPQLKEVFAQLGGKIVIGAEENAKTMVIQFARAKYQEARAVYDSLSGRIPRATIRPDKNAVYLTLHLR